MRRATLILCLLPALLAVSCISWRGPQELSRDLSRAAGVELHREFGLTVGPGVMWIARAAMKHAGEDEISLRGVKSVRVGVYEVRGLRPGHERRARLALDLLPPWHTIVRIQDDGEEVFVMTRLDENDEIREMLVVVAEDDEWVLVKIKGRLQHVVDDAMRMAFDQSDRPDLYARAQEERCKESVGDDGAGQLLAAGNSGEAAGD